MKMKKVKTYKGFVITKNQSNEYQVFTKEEWSYGDGYRTAEFDCCSEKECIENIDSYNCDVRKIKVIRRK
jgi:hypothetical protein